MFASAFGGHIPMMIEGPVGSQTLFLVNFANIQNEMSNTLDGVHFYTGDGVKYPESLSSSVTLALDGYTFEGWSTQANSTDLINEDTFVPNLKETEDATEPETITLYAVYSKIADLSATYTVKYVYEDNSTAYPTHSVELANSEELTVNSPVISGAVADITSVKLIGGQSNEETVVTYKKDTSEFKFEVVYLMQNVDGTGYEQATISGTAPIGTKITLSNLDKYTTDTMVDTTGFTNMSGDVQVTISNEEANNNFEVTFDRNFYYITFNTDGGSTIQNQKLRYGQTVTRLTSNPTRVGYNFVKFIDKNSNDVNTTNPIPSTMPAENLEYTAIWESEEVNYSVVYWLEDPDAVPSVQLTEDNGLYNKDNYNYYNTETFTANSGEEITELPAGIDTIEHATQSWSDIDNGSIIVKGDGTSVINVYFTRTVYTLTFDPTKVRSGNGVSTATTSLYLEFNGEEHKEKPYSFSAKYQQDITDLWPGITTGASVYYLENGNIYSSFAGWYMAGEGSSLITKVFTLEETHIPDEGTSVTFVRQNGQVGLVDVYYYFEPLPEEVMPSEEFDVLTYGGNVYYNNYNYAHEGLPPMWGEYTNKALAGLRYKSVIRSAEKVIDTSAVSQLMYDRIDYKLSYNLQGGEYNGANSIATKTLMFEQPLQGIKEEYQFMPDASLMQKDGYTFGGWYYEPECMTLVDWENDIMPSDNLSVFAKWDAPEITFNANGGYLEDANGITSFEQSIESTPENRISSPTGYEIKHADENMSFAGWYIGDEQYLFDEELTDDITVTARWILNESASYKVIHMLEGFSTIKITNLVENQKAGSQVLVYPLTSKDLIDAGWAAGYYKADKSSITVNVSGKTVETVVFTYTLVETEEYPYTVKYVNVNNQAEQVAANDEFINNENSHVTIYAKDIAGYKRVGFENGMITPVDSKFVSLDVSETGNETIVFYYQEVSDPVMYTINFNSPEDNTISIPSIQISANRWDRIVAGELSVVDTALEPYAEKYQFEGDYEVAKVLGKNTVFNIDIMPKDLTATFYNNHDILDTSIFKEIDAPYKGDFDFADEFLGTPTKVGFNFMGWSAEQNSEIQDALSADELETEVSDNVSYYALWEQIKVTFDVNGGDELPEDVDLEQIVNDEGKLEDYPTPTRDGFNFIGWYTETTTSGDKTDLDYVYVKDTTIYAIWEEITETVTVTESEEEPTTPVLDDPTPETETDDTQIPPAPEGDSEGEGEDIQGLIENVNVDIGESNVPFGGQRRAWALVNLIAALFTALLSGVLIITYLSNKKDEEDEEEQNAYDDEDKKAKLKRKGLLRILSVIIALAALIIFFLTEDMTLTMVYIDTLTPLMLGIAFVQLIVAFLARKKVKEADEEEQKA